MSPWGPAASESKSSQLRSTDALLLPRPKRRQLSPRQLARRIVRDMFRDQLTRTPADAGRESVAPRSITVAFCLFAGIALTGCLTIEAKSAAALRAHLAERAEAEPPEGFDVYQSYVLSKGGDRLFSVSFYALEDGVLKGRCWYYKDAVTYDCDWFVVGNTLYEPTGMDTAMGAYSGGCTFYGAEDSPRQTDGKKVAWVVENDLRNRSMTIRGCIHLDETTGREVYHDANVSRPLRAENDELMLDSLTRKPETPESSSPPSPTTSKPLPDPSTAPAPAEGASPQERLAALKQLLDDGLITREDYEAKKKAILDQL